MAIITPFKGVLYNRDKIPALEDVTTPPYDVISEEERNAYYGRHPKNVIRLVLNRPEPNDNNGDNRYTRAAGYFRQWLKEGILRRDTQPALYLTEMDYTVGETKKTRFGFVSLVRLEDFDQGGILPHEKTFSATKADRLQLMRASRAHFCPIFSLYSDPDGEVEKPLRTWAEKTEPDLTFEESIGFRHRLWRVTDTAVCEKVSQRLENRPLYIADGHHRYETALNYRDEMLSKGKNPGADASCHYVMMYLCSMQDPGLALRPVHRLLCHVSPGAMNGFIEKARSYFDVETLPATGGSNNKDARRLFFHQIKAGEKHGVIGAALRGRNELFVLRVKKGMMDQLFKDSIPGPLRKLDVTVVTKLVIEDALGISRAEQDDPKRVLFTSRAGKAFDALQAGSCDVVLIMNPTRLSHVEEISRARLIMPRKSTYFYPKVLSGLVMNQID